MGLTNNEKDRLKRDVAWDIWNNYAHIIDRNYIEEVIDFCIEDWSERHGDDELTYYALLYDVEDDLEYYLSKLIGIVD